jgi:cytoskeletal protein RodZ
MDGSCGSVSLDRYWNNVAIPFLFIVLGFGLFVLFSLSDIQFTSTEKVVNMVGAIASSVPLSRSRREDEPPPPAGNVKATPPSAGNVKPPKASPPAANAGKSQPATNANMQALAVQGVGK